MSPSLADLHVRAHAGAEAQQQGMCLPPSLGPRRQPRWVGGTRPREHKDKARHEKRLAEDLRQARREVSEPPGGNGRGRAL